ncbi:uncharacterized protein DSM5745_06592 [Aspergillus mulundensis]|uniref:Uncharacterized protein n=1 Tax=Aspergillus mulundensis TaxID=1810919 RepID=A0A3D8RRK3_9EURO|nr:hypothetical protein DSM5745_06592 [Aspergillus mulundensis]RDW76600.1 hypothetical protein DSM5745_06592 [Aspergillus mulundensis]
MSSTTTEQIRNRLDTLWKVVLSSATDEQLEQDNVIPDSLLKAHNIRLSRHTFTADYETNSSYNPPILFCSRAPRLMRETPINPQDFDENCPVGDKALKYPNYVAPPAGVINIYHTRWCPTKRTVSATKYLEKWALNGFPRRLPPGVVDMATNCDIQWVGVPHPIYPDSRGFHRSWPVTNEWESRIYECGHMLEQTDFPHVILITHHSCNGHEGSIMQGELAAIITAMRNRADQPLTLAQDDAGDK